MAICPRCPAVRQHGVGEPLKAAREAARRTHRCVVRLSTRALPTLARMRKSTVSENCSARGPACGDHGGVGERCEGDHTARRLALIAAHSGASAMAEAMARNVALIGLDTNTSGLPYPTISP
jgi:hypothetical protein